MTKLLIRLFIKDYQNTKSEKVRLRYGVLSGVTGIVLNIILSVFKMIFGAISNSISIIADGANNIFDAISSIISLVGFKISGKPADDEHPFGHGRIEYVASMIVSFLVVLIGFELMKESIGKTPLSASCVRVNEKSAKWIYDNVNVPLKSRVWIW